MSDQENNIDNNNSLIKIIRFIRLSLIFLGMLKRGGPSADYKRGS